MPRLSIIRPARAHRDVSPDPPGEDGPTEPSEPQRGPSQRPLCDLRDIINSMTTISRLGKRSLLGVEAGECVRLWSGSWPFHDTYNITRTLQRGESSCCFSHCLVFKWRRGHGLPNNS